MYIQTLLGIVRVHSTYTHVSVSTPPAQLVCVTGSDAGRGGPTSSEPQRKRAARTWQSCSPPARHSLSVTNRGEGRRTLPSWTGHHSPRNASRSHRPHQRHHEPAPRAVKQARAVGPADPATPVEGAGPREGDIKCSCPSTRRRRWTGTRTFAPIAPSSGPTSRSASTRPTKRSRVWTRFVSSARKDRTTTQSRPRVLARWARD